jgi:mono/diheme cytochrome c family protein
MLQRGQQRFDIYCSPCHGRLGDGIGMIAKRGFKIPANLNEDRLRQAPPGYLFEVISNGYGAMPDYGGQINAEDRWAIVAYIRALQLSRNATLADVPPEAKATLGAK